MSVERSSTQPLTPLEVLIKDRKHYLGYARVLLDKLNTPRHIDDPSAADDVLQEVMIHMYELQQLPEQERPMITHPEIYIRSSIRNACFDVLRRMARSRTSPGGSMNDLDALPQHTRPEHAWITQTNMSPDRRMLWKGNVGEPGNQEDTLWKYVVEGIDPRTNTRIDPKRIGELLRRDQRSRAVLRLALEGYVADDIIRQLASEDWFKEYDLDDPKQLIQARNTVYQVTHRGFERAKTSLEKSGCIEEFTT